MRKEPFSTGDYVHVFNRGNRKLPIVKDTGDRDHFLQMLYYFNTRETPSNPFGELRKLSERLRFNLNDFVWPDEWQSHQPIVGIINFALVENHFHFLLKEVIEGGIAKFMQRFGTGMTMFYNTKYQESGTLFQGSYKARRVDSDFYLKYLTVYIQIKNVFEIYPGGLKKAISEFDKAYNWAIKYPYCSLGDYLSEGDSKIISEHFTELFSNPKEYKDFIFDCLRNVNLEDELKDYIFI